MGTCVIIVYTVGMREVLEHVLTVGMREVLEHVLTVGLKEVLERSNTWQRVVLEHSVLTPF